MDRKKLAAVTAAVVIVGLFGWLWFLGTDAKNICTEDNNLNKLIPIALLSKASQEWPISEADIPAACYDGAADYVPCIEAIGLGDSVEQECIPAQRKMQSFTASICAANEIVVGIDALPALFALEVCEEVEYGDGQSAVFCSRKGESLNLFGKREAIEAITLCMEAIGNYAETAG